MAGGPVIEVSAFVSPEWVPQMADAAAVFAGITRRPGTRYTALVPNARGLDRVRGYLSTSFGCPYAPGAPGNLATEVLLDLLDGLGHETGVDRAAVAAATDFIHRADQIARPASNPLRNRRHAP